MKNYKLWIKNILISLIVGGIVGVVISKYIDYNTLNKPILSPPSYIFPIVWTILYILMGISYSIIETKQQIDNQAKNIYYTQLLVNALWSIIFFILKWRFISIIWILILLILVIYMTVIFYNKNKTSGLLQIPYIIWLIFATYLNIGVYILNK